MDSKCPVAQETSNVASETIENKRPQLPCGLPSKCEWSLNTEVKSPHRHLPLPAPSKIKNSILECVGNTPIVRLNRVPARHNLKCEVLVKCEYFNAGGSVKDRIALRMIEEAEAKGLIKPGYTLIEPTSGKSGFASLYLRSIITMTLRLICPLQIQATPASASHWPPRSKVTAASS